ncbi:integrase core domain-containing protein [Teichococcus aestuarii]|uniref:integrase core domain-containing protein n=1 Tax=Teichococcus aestuarii TaxID=568898 RepID=UPI003620118D
MLRVLAELPIERGPPDHIRSGNGRAFAAKAVRSWLGREIFCSLCEAEVQIERWWRHDNTVRPRSALGYRPPAPDTSCLTLLGLPTLCSRTPSRARHAAGWPW